MKSSTVLADGLGRQSAKEFIELGPPRKKSREAVSKIAIKAAAWTGPRLGRIGPLRRTLANYWDHRLHRQSEAEIRAGYRPEGVVKDRAAMGIAILRTIERALAKGCLSPATVNKLLNILVGVGIVTRGDPDAKVPFIEEYGVRPPGFLLVSPTKACNLHCQGCYADSGATKEKLEWEIMDRMFDEARHLWGAPFLVVSGGEPLIYRDRGRGMLDLFEKHSNCFFMMYTNGTLIDERTARVMAELGNISPAISVEGLKKETDGRRGEGTFDRVLKAMNNLRREKVFFGISLTATRDNAETILSDEVVDFYFEEMGAMFAWIFHYMPIGRAFTLKLLPTPEQRLWMWQRSWQLVNDRHLFIADFWNSGTAAKGCLAAGHRGGYMTVDWNGAVSSCVFMPYSPVNIHDVYAHGQTLNEAWAHPFFARIRAWQDEYSNEMNYSQDGRHGNWMMPCPIRDHYAEFYEMLKAYQPKPVDENAEAAMNDPDYRKGMEEYNTAVGALFDPIWTSRYSKGGK